MEKAIGAVLIGVPFIAMLAAMVATAGWKATVGIWSVSLIATAMVYGGVYLLVK